MNSNSLSEYDVFIDGSALALVVLSERLVRETRWYQWFNDAETTRYLQKHYFPNTLEAQLSFFQKELSDPGPLPSKVQLGIVHKSDRVMTGVISLNSIDYIHRRCDLSILVGEKRYQKLELFTEANRLMIGHAFDQLNLNRVGIATLSKDLHGLYVRILGFKDEGVTYQEVYKSGKYHDAYRAGILKETYLHTQHD
jgi:ribosomal-protein-alanine N-acetyltransferase